MEDRSEFVMQTLMDIKKDIGEVKTEIKGLIKSVDDNSADTKKDIDDLNAKIEVLDNRVDALEHADEAKDSKRFRSVLNYFWVALGTYFVAKFPSIIAYIIDTAGKE